MFDSEHIAFFFENASKVLRGSPKTKRAVD